MRGVELRRAPVKFAASGPWKFDDLVPGLLFWALVGAPFSRGKCRGGVGFDWFGCWLDCERFELGLPEKRATWILGFPRKGTGGIFVLVGYLGEGLGGLSFGAGVQGWFRPFLAPVCAWVSAVPQGAYLPVQAMVPLAFAFFPDRLPGGGRAAP